MLKKLFFAGSVLVFGALQVQAQTNAPKYSNEFLAIGVGGRAQGMGNVQVGQVNDATAGYWNPAGLLNQKTKFSVALQHSELFAGIAGHDYLGGSMQLDSNSVLGISFIRLGVDNIANTLNLIDNEGRVNYDNITFFSVADYAGIISYARRSQLIDGLKLGGSAKIIHRNVGEFANAWGFGVDLGAQLQRGNWQLGVMARDLTSTFNAWSYNTALLQDAYTQTGNAIPENRLELTLPKLILGTGYNYQFTDKVGALAAIDFDITFDGKRNVLIKSDFASVDPHFGLELNYDKLVFVRGGLSNTQKFRDLDGGTSTKVQPHFGLGVAVRGFNLDLALAKLADNSKLNSVIVSLAYNFNK
jgi:hypothetical protein